MTLTALLLLAAAHLAQVPFEGSDAAKSKYPINTKAITQMSSLSKIALETTLLSCYYHRILLPSLGKALFLFSFSYFHWQGLVGSINRLNAQELHGLLKRRALSAQ